MTITFYGICSYCDHTIAAKTVPLNTASPAMADNLLVAAFAAADWVEAGLEIETSIDYCRPIRSHDPKCDTQLTRSQLEG